VVNLAEREGHMKSNIWLLILGAASLPFWYLFLVKQGYPPGTVSTAGVITLAVLVVILAVARPRAKKTRDQ
jgi:glucan phosphoethanolaminetransferase (alkaline phosphatase superfamily)